MTMTGSARAVTVRTRTNSERGDDVKTINVYVTAVTVTTITKFERGDDVVTRNSFCDQRLLGEEMTSSRATIFATRDFRTRR